MADERKSNLTSVFVLHVEDHHSKPDRLEVYATEEAVTRRATEIVAEYTDPEENWFPEIDFPTSGDVFLRAHLTEDNDWLTVRRLEVMS